MADLSAVPLKDVVPRGFVTHAHLRLRDHRPGAYQLPITFGPGSGSREPSIFPRRPRPSTGLNTVGPGEYVLPDVMGTGPATRFGPPLPVDEKGNPIFPAPPDPPAIAHCTTKVSPCPKQYSMALTPDGPLYSIAEKLSTGWIAADGGARPSAYDVPDRFTVRKWGVPPGAHFGIRGVSAAEREKLLIPGPGTYTLQDLMGGKGSVAREKGWGCGRSTRRGDLFPGPGSYDDPTTIQSRITANRRTMRMCTSSTFGGRCRERGGKGSVGPGPGRYNTDAPSRIIERNKRHAPRFMQPSIAPLRPHEEPRTSRLHLPSDFDYSAQKGKSMLWRWDDPTPPVHPGGYMPRDLTLPRGGRFAGHPYDPFASEGGSQKAAATDGGSVSGVPMYDVSYRLVEPRAPCAVVTGLPGNGLSIGADVTPGPGHYHPDYDAVFSQKGGTVFHLGDFRGRGLALDTPGVGPGSNYNDLSAYSGSIQGNAAHGKGFTFGLRYPARATHQVCKPYDETTNINCVYPDEVTWETKVRFAPTKLPSAV